MPVLLKFNSDCNKPEGMTKSYFFPKSGKRAKIEQFLSKMNIHQVFPGEIDIVKDVLMKKQSKSKVNSSRYVHFLG